MDKWDNPQEPIDILLNIDDDEIEPNAHNIRIGALIFFIWSVVMMMLGIGIGRYLIH